MLDQADTFPLAADVSRTIGGTIIHNNDLVFVTALTHRLSDSIQLSADRVFLVVDRNHDAYHLGAGHLCLLSRLWRVALWPQTQYNTTQSMVVQEGAF